MASDGGCVIGGSVAGPGESSVTVVGGAEVTGSQAVSAREISKAKNKMRLSMRNSLAGMRTLYRRATPIPAFPQIKERIWGKEKSRGVIISNMSLAQFIYTEVLKPKPLRALTNAILLRILPKSTRVGAATIHLDSTDPVVSGAITLRAYEPSELQFFQQHCRGDLTLVDVGANIGLYTSLAMHGLSSRGRILAFEPRPQSFALLEKNIASNHRDPSIALRAGAGPRVDAFNLAASTQPGAFTLYQNPDNHGDNRLYHSQDFEWQTIEVQARPLDEVLTEQGVTEINFLKMDVQGYEQQVLGGLKQTLRRSSKVILMTEFWPKGLTEAGGGPLAYLEDLSDLGFQLFELKESPRGKLVPLGDWDGLIQNLKGRKYANIVGAKGIRIH